jgi:hypothetical protein
MYLVRAALVALLLSAGVAAAEPRKIAIEIVGQAKFDIVYHRATSNATGAAIGGLIGAGIQSGIEAGQDSTKREALLPHVAAGAWRDVFIRTMEDALAAKGFEPIWIEQGSRAKHAADIYLTLFPETFGFRIVDSNTSLVSAYVEFEAVYTDQPISKGKSRPRETFYLTDKTQSSYEKLLEDTASISPRIESVLALAARRLTNKMLYNVKPPDGSP